MYIYKLIIYEYNIIAIYLYLLYQCAIIRLSNCPKMLIVAGYKWGLRVVDEIKNALWRIYGKCRSNIFIWYNMCICIERKRMRDKRTVLWQTHCHCSIAVAVVKWVYFLVCGLGGGRHRCVWCTVIITQTTTAGQRAGLLFARCRYVIWNISVTDFYTHWDSINYVMCTRTKSGRSRCFFSGNGVCVKKKKWKKITGDVGIGKKSFFNLYIIFYTTAAVCCVNTKYK